MTAEHVVETLLILWGASVFLRFALWVKPRRPKAPRCGGCRQEMTHEGSYGWMCIPCAFARPTRKM
jgi:hypothetical protein